MKGRVGVLGGTFNPIHNAHILIARTALRQFGLSQIILVPNGIPPNRRDEPRPGKEDRFHMVEAAVASEDRLAASRIEVDREGPSYTIDTIRALKDDYPEGICLIVGADCLVQIETWKEPEAILASVPLIVAPRAGVPMPVFEQAPFLGASICTVDMPEVELSSTVLRIMVRSGQSIGSSVPVEVEAYIAEHGLYRNTDDE
ncbi:MAG: nicotinate-nucleotide adenylyltransferase [Candidatus Bipolaricaulia bacterium]